VNFADWIKLQNAKFIDLDLDSTRIQMDALGHTKLTKNSVCPSKAW